MEIFDAPMVGSHHHMREILNQAEYQANYKLLVIFKHAEKNWVKSSSVQAFSYSQIIHNHVT